MELLPRLPVALLVSGADGAEGPGRVRGRDGQLRADPQGEGAGEEGEVQDQPVQPVGVGDDLAQQVAAGRQAGGVSEISFEYGLRRCWPRKNLNGTSFHDADNVQSQLNLHINFP